MLVVHAEIRLDPNDPTRRSSYLETELITRRLNGTGHIYLKPE